MVWSVTLGWGGGEEVVFSPSPTSWELVFRAWLLLQAWLN